MKGGYYWLIGVFGRPWAAAVPALATATLGLIGGYFLWELRSDHAPSPWLWLAVGVTALLVAVVTALREAGRDHRQKTQSDELHESIQAVREVAQTMPPRTFLSDFDRLIQRDAEATERVVRGYFEQSWESDADRAKFRERIDETIRHILDAVLDLAWTWDEASTEPGVVYRVNVMWYYSRAYLEDNADLRADVLRDLRFHPDDEREALLDDEYTTGALLVDPALTTNSFERGAANPDDPEPLALVVGPMLESPITDQAVLEGIRARNLPGAPTAVATVRSDYVEDSDEFAVHVDDNGLYTPTSRQRIAEYYRDDYKGKSIVSFTIRGPVSAATDEAPVTLGAVNVYRNYAGIMGGQERARQFALVTAPFRHLLFRLMLLRGQVDRAEKEPNNGPYTKE
ncbi:hypothetical protein QWY84_16125 [Aquisalimonas lutea]|uniref:hypothetical protein n=1 Tax=Aquisalimonas lutea TaxID=1327750 RepID=UPI0025B4097A|nr:hypothetical protein [Aquisalimonas lutea]MDN3519143.1 hypothetical protein [Aquisalimonas lutea]